MFYEFQNAYENSAQFPEPALARIPPSLVTCIDMGARSFFSPLQTDFPRLYGALVQRCHSLRLLENVVWNQSGSRQHLFCWGADLEGRHLRIGIPFNDPETELFKLKFEPMLNCLPKEFRAFYLHMDGIGLLESGEIYGRELPLGFSHWRHLTKYLTDRDIDVVAGIAQNLNQTFKLLVETRQHHLILSESDKSKALYCAFAPHYDAIFQLESPVKLMDGYFSEVIRGNSPDLSDLLGHAKG